MGGTEEFAGVGESRRVVFTNFVFSLFLGRI